MTGHVDILYIMKQDIAEEEVFLPWEDREEIESHMKGNRYLGIG